MKTFYVDVTTPNGKLISSVEVEALSPRGAYCKGVRALAPTALAVAVTGHGPGWFSAILEVRETCQELYVRATQI